MHQIESGAGIRSDAERTTRETFEKRYVLRLENRAGPFRRGASGRIVHSYRIQAHANPIMIAADHDGRMLAGPLGDVIGVRAVAHHVAETQHPVVETFGVLDHSVQSFLVAVDVAEDQIRHSFIKATSGGAPSRVGKPIVPIPRDTKMDEEGLR